MNRKDEIDNILISRKRYSNISNERLGINYKYIHSSIADKKELTVRIVDLTDLSHLIGVMLESDIRKTRKMVEEVVMAYTYTASYTNSMPLLANAIYDIISGYVTEEENTEASNLAAYALDRALVDVELSCTELYVLGWHEDVTSFHMMLLTV